MKEIADNLQGNYKIYHQLATKSIDEQLQNQSDCSLPDDKLSILLQVKTSKNHTKNRFAFQKLISKYFDQCC